MACALVFLLLCLRLTGRSGRRGGAYLEDGLGASGGSGGRAELLQAERRERREGQRGGQPAQCQPVRPAVRLHRSDTAQRRRLTTAELPSRRDRQQDRRATPAPRRHRRTGVDTGQRGGETLG